MNVEPNSRIEHYLDVIANSETPEIEPVSRIDHYVAKIAGMDVTLPEPVTRIEEHLAAIAESGGGGGDLPFKEITVNFRLVQLPDTPDLQAQDTFYFSMGDPDAVGYTSGVALDEEQGLAVEVPEINVVPDTPASQTIYLLDGHSFVIEHASNAAELSVTGDAEIRSEEEEGETYYYVVVSGDCTIAATR